VDWRELGGNRGLLTIPAMAAELLYMLVLTFALVRLPPTRLPTLNALILVVQLAGVGGASFLVLSAYWGFRFYHWLVGMDKRTPRRENSLLGGVLDTVAYVRDEARSDVARSVLVAAPTRVLRVITFVLGMLLALDAAPVLLLWFGSWLSILLHASPGLFTVNTLLAGLLTIPAFCGFILIALAWLIPTQHYAAADDGLHMFSRFFHRSIPWDDVARLVIGKPGLGLPFYVIVAHSGGLPISWQVRSTHFRAILTGERQSDVTPEELARIVSQRSGVPLVVDDRIPL
jgi:hypothetical protein